MTHCIGWGKAHTRHLAPPAKRKCLYPPTKAPRGTRHTRGRANKEGKATKAKEVRQNRRGGCPSPDRGVLEILNCRFSQAITESTSIDSKDSQKQNRKSNFLESKQLTESTTPKTLSRLCPIQIIVRAQARCLSAIAKLRHFCKAKITSIWRCASTNRPSPLSWW